MELAWVEEPGGRTVGQYLEPVRSLMEIPNQIVDLHTPNFKAPDEFQRNESVDMELMHPLRMKRDSESRIQSLHV